MIALRLQEFESFPGDEVVGMNVEIEFWMQRILAMFD